MNEQNVKQIAEKTLSQEIQTLQKLVELYACNDAAQVDEKELKTEERPEELLKLYFHKQNRG